MDTNTASLASAPRALAATAGAGRHRDRPARIRRWRLDEGLLECAPSEWE
jgi:hypothetical protein